MSWKKGTTKRAARYIAIKGGREREREERKNPTRPPVHCVHHLLTTSCACLAEKPKSGKLNEANQNSSFHCLSLVFVYYRPRKYQKRRRRWGEVENSERRRKDRIMQSNFQAPSVHCHIYACQETRRISGSLSLSHWLLDLSSLTQF